MTKSKQNLFSFLEGENNNMAFVTSLKDYLDHINYLSFVFEHNFSIWIFFKSLFIYFYKSLSLFFIYIISFKWLTDFIELPVIFKHNYISIIQGKNIFQTSFETELEKSFFLFLDNSTSQPLTVFTGFINSFFLCLPFSVAHLLSIRSFLINGIPAGIWSIAGTLLGQIVFFSCILFGIEFLIVPFLRFEFLPLLVGFSLLTNVIYQMTHNPNMKIFNFSQKKELFQFFKINFFLAWVEQMCIYSYFGNLTITNSSNLLQITHSNHFFLSTVFYLFGLLLGSILWTVFFGFVIFKLYNFVINRVFFNVPFSLVNEKFHYLTLGVISLFCFNNIPYYGCDYLISGPLGFIYEDKALEVLKPKINYKAIATFDEPPGYYEFWENSLPFDNANYIDWSAPEETIKYEHHNLDFEFLWKNRLQLQRYDKDPSATTQITLTKSNLKPLYISKYDTHDIEEEDIFRPNLAQRQENAVEVIVNSLFRDDVYVAYRDANKEFITADDQFLASKQAQVHRRFREKYLSNPVYKALVNFDMHLFLTGQMNASNLTAEDEFDLFERRIILENYLHSIQYYKPVVSKSYAERVYNHQFKGSLSFIRQFNSIKLNHNLIQTELDDQTKKVLKFDQPKYNEFVDASKTLLHEELLVKKSKKMKKIQKTNKKATKSYEYSDNQSMGYLNLNNTTPLYVGWDGLLRKFLIKVPTVPTQLISGDNAMQNNDKQPPVYFSFQSWPACLNKPLTSEKGKLVKLPTVELSATELQNVKNALNLDFTQKSYKNLTVNMKQVLKNRDVEALLNRLPSYDWHWKKKTLEFKYLNYLNVGNALPSQLDGIAWPGINNDLLQKMKQSK